MLEQMRRNSRSLVIYTLFGILIAVFILSFGPQSGQQTAGCSARKSYAVEVEGHTVSEPSWRYGMVAYGGGNVSGERARAQRLRETVVDKLIERELLALAAEAAGFGISDTEVESAIARGDIFILGQRQLGQFAYYDERGFNYDRLKAYAQGLGLSGVPAFKEEQKRERLAQKMRDLITSSLRVSPEEVETAYIRDTASVTLEFVKFPIVDFKDGVVPTDAELDTFLKDHAADVEARFQRDKALYVGGGPWVKLRTIVIPRETEPVPVAAKPDGTMPPALPDPGEAKARAALARLKAGEDFAKVAQATSKDARSAVRGGLSDWRRMASLAAWGQKATEAITALKPGQLHGDVLITDSGYVIVKLETRSDTDPTADQVKRDLAWDMVIDVVAKQRARAAAEEALAKAKAGTALVDQFPPNGTQRLRLTETGPLKKRGSTVGNDTMYVGNSPELAAAVFDATAKDHLGDAAYDVEDGTVIFRVADKVTFDAAEFAKVKADRSAEMAAARGARLVTAWAQERCETTFKAGKISVNETFLDYGILDPASGKPLKVSYRPCASYGGGSGGDLRLDPTEGGAPEGAPGMPPMPELPEAPMPSAPPAPGAP